MNNVSDERLKKNFESWDENVLEHFKTLERFAIDNNCNRIQIRSGRKGWAKPLEQFNMKVTAYTFEKSLNKE